MQAVGDDDEWVRVIGRAVGDFSGSLDLDAVVSESRLVSFKPGCLLRQCRLETLTFSIAHAFLSVTVRHLAVRVSLVARLQVAGTMAELNRLLDEHKPCPDFRPLEAWHSWLHSHLCMQ